MTCAGSPHAAHAAPMRGLGRNMRCQGRCACGVRVPARLYAHAGARPWSAQAGHPVVREPGNNRTTQTRLSSPGASKTPDPLRTSPLFRSFQPADLQSCLSLLIPRPVGCIDLRRLRNQQPQDPPPASLLSSSEPISQTLWSKRVQVPAWHSGHSHATGLQP